MTEGTITGNSNAEAIGESSLQQMGDYLENILTRQLEKVRNYDLDGAIELAEEANELAATIGREGWLNRPEHSEQHDRVQKLYRDISLIIAVERGEVADKLKVIRKGIKTLGIYGKNM